MRNNQLMTDMAMQEVHSSHTMAMYPLGRRVRRHTTYDWRTAFANVKTPHAVEKPQMNVANVIDLGDGASAWYQSGTRSPGIVAY